MPLPNRPEKIAQRWLNRGLTFLSLGNGLYWSKSRGWVGGTTAGGTPKKIAAPSGVSHGFGSTFGTGTTDRIATGIEVPYSTGWRSIVSFRFANTVGGGNFGRIFNPAGTNGVSINDECMFPNASNNGMEYSKAGTFVWQWAATTPIVTGAWACDGLTHDQRSTGITPTMYLNGTSVAVTVIVAGAGAYPTSGGFTLDIGNRSTDSARNWDGMLGLLVFFNDPSQGLTDKEHLEIYTNPNTLFDGMSDDVYGFDAAVTVYRPGSDVVVAGWTGTPDNVNLYTNIDEASASDADYITSPNIDGSQGPFIDGLTASVPVGTWDVKYRSDYNSGTAKQVRMTLLDSSNVSVGAGAWQTVTTSFVLYTSTITTTGVATRFKIEVQ